MIKKLFHAILLRRRFWRYASMSEVAEMYMARMLRSAALYMTSAFVVIYLYQNGFTIMQIAFTWAGLYGFKALIGLPLATVVAWFGPKRSTLFSNLLYIPAMILLAAIPEYGDWALFPALGLQAVSVVLYTIAHSVNFSKVKSLHKAGREIATMNIVEKATAGVSPLIGGFIAFLWGPQLVIALSAVLFLFAATPLLRTGEQIQTRRVLKFTGFPWRLFFGQLPAHLAVGYDVFTSGVAWSLYVAIVVIGMSDGSDSVYAVTGVLLSIVLVVALVFSYIYGQLIDKERGLQLYRVGAVASIASHALRPFVTTTIVVVGINAAREATHTAYMLPYTRGTFDAADISGARSTYIGLADVGINIGASLSAVTLGCLAFYFSEPTALKFLFFATAGVMLLLLLTRFPLYKK